MGLLVDGIRWDILSAYVQKHAPDKSMTDHPSMQVDGKAVLFKEGICTDTTIQPDPIFQSHVIIGDIETSTEASLLNLDPKKKSGLLMMSNSSVGVINEDGTITHVDVPDAKKSADFKSIGKPQMRELATSHLGLHLEILRQMNLI